MAYEWIGTGALGVVGIIFTWLTGKQARDQAERTASGRLEHERTMTREAREQERLSSAYVRLLTVVERSGQWAQMVKPMIDTDPPQSVRPLPDLDEQAEALTLVNAFGSDKIRQAHESWRKLVWEIIRAVSEIDHAATVDAEPYMRLEKLRPRELEAREALAKQIRAELRSGRNF